MTDEKEKQQQYAEMNWMNASIDLFSPRKMLVESTTMIYIITFMMICFAILVWRGAQMNTTQMMGMFFGLLFTFMVAVRQYSSFRR